MEAFTSGKISPAARRAYLETHSNADASWFSKTSGGYKMHAWESQIAYALAMGRGSHSGRGKEPHPFDLIK